MSTISSCIARVNGCQKQIARMIMNHASRMELVTFFRMCATSASTGLVDPELYLIMCYLWAICAATVLKYTKTGALDARLANNETTELDHIIASADLMQREYGLWPVTRIHHLFNTAKDYAEQRDEFNMLWGML